MTILNSRLLVYQRVVHGMFNKGGWSYLLGHVVISDMESISFNGMCVGYLGYLGDGHDHWFADYCLFSQWEMHHLESSLENMSKMFGGVNKTHTRVDGIVYALCSWDIL